MRLLVKICGLTTLADVEVAVAAGADAIGLVLSPSPRRVTGAQAGRLCEAIPAGVERVAVLARPGPEERALLAALPWDAVQVDAEFAREVVLPSGAFLVPSLRADEAASGSLEQAAKFAQEERNQPAPEPVSGLGDSPRRVGARDGRRMSQNEGPRPSLRGAVLVDGPAGGGRGVSVERSVAQGLFDSGRRRGFRLVIAGGLAPENVGEAIRSLRPDGVDVSSGIERSPGTKDPERIRRFLAAVRSTEAALEASPSAS